MELSNLYPRNLSVNVDNSKGDVPYFRASRLENDRLPYEIKVSIFVFLFCYLLNIAGSTLLHFNQRYRYRSVYKRIDIASIFLMIAVNALPIQLYYMNDDILLAVLSSCQWILTFGGVFGALVFDFCCISKNIRSLIHFLFTFPNLYLVYKMCKCGDLAVNTCLGAIYALELLAVVIYCKERPNPILGIFEHQELFHAICAFSLYFVVMLNKVVVFDKFK